MFLNELFEKDIDEGWKDWAAGAAMGVAALGAQPADAKPMPQQPVAQKAADTGINLLSNNIRSEEVVHRTAKAAGIKGTELAQFLAQTRHESADFRSMKERFNGKDAQSYFMKKYDKKYAPQTAKILGNKQVGDGVKYHGRGYIQITGRDNYRMAGQALGLPLEQQPDLASKPDVAAKIAVWYWKTRVKPNVSNFADTAAVTRLINPAMRGLQDRHSHFMDYKKII